MTIRLKEAQPPEQEMVNYSLRRLVVAHDASRGSARDWTTPSSWRRAFSRRS